MHRTDSAFFSSRNQVHIARLWVLFALPGIPGGFSVSVSIILPTFGEDFRHFFGDAKLKRMGKSSTRKLVPDLLRSWSTFQQKTLLLLLLLLLSRTVERSITYHSLYIIFKYNGLKPFIGLNLWLILVVVSLEVNNFYALY